MPQMGHAAGASRTISGCIGQVHCLREADGDGFEGAGFLAAKTSRQCWLQKNVVIPSASRFHGVFEGSTVILHTGSMARALELGDGG